MTFWRDKFPIEEANERRINIYLEYLKNEDVFGLKEVIDSLKSSCDSGLYEDLKNAFHSRHPSYHRVDYKIMPENSVYSLANRNMSRVYLKHLKESTFTSMYKIIEFKYYMTTQREFNEEDIQNVYLSGLDERLIFALDKFDEISDCPQPSAEFFQKLNEVQWEKSTFKFAKILARVKNRIEYEIFGLIKYKRLALIEEEFIELIAGCNVVHNDRNLLSKEDLVIGYTTYLKLLNTDVTKYKARNIEEFTEENENNGYLVCQKCNSYYKLQPGESPEDFVYECECGGKLKYYDDIDWLINDKTV